MNAPGGIEQQDFPTVARGQVNLVDKFLAASDIVALRWRPRAQRKFPQVVQKGFSRDITDPEFKKNLQMLRQLTLGAIGVWQRAQAQAWGQYKRSAAPPSESRNGYAGIPRPPSSVVRANRAC